jgi:hypothetical protein
MTLIKARIESGEVPAPDVIVEVRHARLTALQACAVAWLIRAALSR